MVSRYRIQYPCIENTYDYGCKWRMHADTSKNEDTWCGAFWHYDAELDSTSRIFEGWWHGWRFIYNRNSDDNLYVRYLYWNDDRWNWNNNWLDNDWNDNNPAALRANFFISHPHLTMRVCSVS